MELYEFGFSPNRVSYRTQENAFITSHLFADLADEVLCPSFNQARGKLEYDGLGIVLMDGSTCHTGDRFLDECTWAGIETVVLPPHTSDQV
jgi:hypothetical protein